MNRLWSRVSVRVISVALLVVGIVGGVYLGQGRAVQQQSAGAQLVVQTEADDMQLLKSRQSEHAAARAWQREAEGNAAAKAAAEAKAAAGKARKLEQKAIAKKAADKKAKEDAEKKESSPSGSADSADSGKEVPFTGRVPSSCREYSGNRRIGCTVMLQQGFKIDQFPCLNKLWNRESNWRTKAHNSGSGAYGIPQALPGSKMASVDGDWRNNPRTQILWGLGYIEGRYDSPCGAWRHSENSGWY